MGTIGGAAEILELGVASGTEQQSMIDIIVRNSANMKVALENLVELSKLDEDARRSRHVQLSRAAAEVARQLRETARGKNVEIRLSPNLPSVDVSAAAFELCLSNLVANAIKYSDPAKPQRWVEVRAHVTAATESSGGETVIEVRDNGLGVPAEKRGRLFQRFFRAHEESQEEIGGTGLGLSIVKETVAALGGRAWADFFDDGTSFFFSMPTRRAADEERLSAAASATPTLSGGQSAEGSLR
jgi:signal transduction histidine kinase